MNADGTCLHRSLARAGRWQRVFAVLFASCAGFAGATDLTLSDPADARVTLRFVQTERFTMTRADRASPKRRDALLTELGKYARWALEARVPAGQRLQVDVLDLKRAGSSARNATGAAGDRGEVRIVRDTDPPRIDLHFSLLDAGGAVLRTETRRLRDRNFLMHGDIGDSDALRHEKRLLDEWIEQDFPTPK